jgi:hypothetical protein
MRFSAWSIVYLISYYIVAIVVLVGVTICTLTPSGEGGLTKK